MKEIAKHIAENGPLLSTDLVEWIAAKSKISKENAQKRVSRLIASEAVRRLERFRFKNNAGFLYLEFQFNTPRFWKQLLTVLKAEHSPLFSFIAGVIALGGIVDIEEIRLLSTFPDRLSGKTEFESFFEAAVGNQVIQALDETREVFQINPGIYRNTNYNAYLARKIQTEILLEMLSRWFSMNGILYSKSIVSLVEPEKYFSHYRYSLFGRSYPLEANLKTNESFIALDYLASETALGNEEIDYFVRKVESCRKGNRSTKFLPIILGKYFTPTALSALRAKNIVGTTVKNLLGERVAELLEELNTNLTSMVSEIKNNDLAFVDMIRKVNKTFGMTENLRGKLFEYFVATLLYYEKHLDFEIGKLITDPKSFGKAELDIVMFNGQRAIHIVECKAYSSNIDNIDMEKFFVKARRAINWIKSSEHLRDAEICFYYYALSDFEASALDEIAKNSKINVTVRNGSSIREMVRSYKERDLSKTYEEFFAPEPTKKPVPRRESDNGKV